MAIIARKWTPAGEQSLEIKGANSISEASRLEPDGIYDVLRIFPQGQVVLLDSHFDRIENTARVLGYSVVLERQSIRDCIKRLVYQSGYAESKLKFFLPYDNLQEVWLVLEDFANQAAALDAMKKTGVTAAVQRIQRMNPLAKTVQWVKTRMNFEGSLKEKPYENLIVNHSGEILEGFSSNFYGIIKGKIYTSQEKVLPGIARKILVTSSQGILPIRYQPVHYDQVPMLEEAFLTSSSRGILPIVRIDQQIIGNGTPGTGTKRLLKAYWEWVSQHLEQIC